MQQIFLCPTCGAQNIVGQEFCQACGQRFQYNCPYCGAVVDSTLVNCPKCRESLYWPTLQRVKAFPKQPETRKGPSEVAGEEGEKPKKKKSDPWLLGCLGLVIIAILVLGAYFIYDNFIRKPPPTPELPPSSDNRMYLELIAMPDIVPFEEMATIPTPEIEAHKDV
jgi:uncharacterized membrane protein YvbJ